MSAAPAAAADDLPGRVVPYALEAGGGRAHLLLGEVGRVLAGAEETADGLSVMTLTGPAAPRPIPMHFHEAEHEIFYCVRGRVQVWAGDQSRVLTPGGLASVPAGTLHAYQLLDHCSQFMGPIVPSGWDRFFDLVGTPYDGPAYPPVDPSPPPFAKFGQAQEQFRMSYDREAPYVEPTAGAPDDALPGCRAPYFLRAGEGPRHAAFGQVAFQLVTGAETDGQLGMAVVEGPAGSQIPFHRHERTAEELFCLAGLLRVELDGQSHLLAPGDFANVPAGVEHRITFERHLTGLATMNAPAGIERFHELAGAVAQERIFAATAEPADPEGLKRAAAQLDVVLPG